MNIYPRSIKNKLEQTIQKLLENREKFANNPNKDLIRNRKLSLKMVIELLITMGAGSQNKELLEFFKFDASLPTASALIQQRNKLKPHQRFSLSTRSSVSPSKKSKATKAIAF
ncbi:MAG: hypothetical protein HY818_10810 [Acetobacterium woodii]|nr:hypothetical protein [Acetobacterium woodii]